MRLNNHYTLRLFLCLLLCLLITSVAYADTVLQMHALFGGTNIYAPTVILDGATYKMWYGGWQVPGAQDKIYFRTSANNSNWSAPMTVLVPSQIGPGVLHVNDPSVTKHFNQTNGQLQYTMFYTVCMLPCEQQDNQIWSSTSSNGITWTHHQPLLNDAVGSAEPSAIIEPGAGGFWKVYYVDRLDATKVKMIRVDGNRNRVSEPQVVYQHSGGAISGVEVRQIGGTWHLFFNAFFVDKVDIYRTESASNELWPSAFTILIENSGPAFCGTLTPGVLPASDVQYDLYYGLTPRSADGSCNLTQQQSIQRWRFAL